LLSLLLLLVTTTAALATTSIGTNQTSTPSAITIPVITEYHAFLAFGHVVHSYSVRLR